MAGAQLATGRSAAPLPGWRRCGERTISVRGSLSLVLHACAARTRPCVSHQGRARSIRSEHTSCARLGAQLEARLHGRVQVGLRHLALRGQAQVGLGPKLIQPPGQRLQAQPRGGQAWQALVPAVGDGQPARRAVGGEAGASGGRGPAALAAAALRRPRRRAEARLSRICCSICRRAGRPGPYTLRSISSLAACSALPWLRMASTGWEVEAPSLRVTRPSRSASCGALRRGRPCASCGGSDAGAGGARRRGGGDRGAHLLWGGHSNIAAADRRHGRSAWGRSGPHHS